jgi:protein-S-isoprenylcysteine O-methyltransferase Ste14
MDFFPTLSFGLLYGWVMLAAYFIGLIISSLAFPADKRRWLYHEAQYPVGHPRWYILMLGRVCAISFVILSIFTALNTGSALFYLGIVIYAIGYIVVMVAMNDLKQVSVGEVTTTGLYRYSRNPQWLGLVMVFLGTVLAMGVWLHLLLVLIVVLSYHVQILLEEQVCLEFLGEKYRLYKSRVPRYLFV